MVLNCFVSIGSVMAAFDTSCPYVFEMTFFCIFVLGITFVYSPNTEFMGLVTLSFACFLMFMVIVYHFHQLGRFDWVGFSLLASLGLTLSGFVMILQYYSTVVKSVGDVVASPSLMSAFATDAIQLFETMFLAVFSIWTVLYLLFTWNAKRPSAAIYKNQPLPLLTKILFSFFQGNQNLNFQEREQRSYVLGTLPLALTLLGISSYNVYVANILHYIVPLG